MVWLLRHIYNYKSEEGGFKTERTDKFTLLTTGPLKKLIVRMAVPGIISMLITAIYNLVDTFFVGFLGTSASGAIGVVYAYSAVTLATGLLFGHGSGNYVSRCLGARKIDDAARMLATGFFACFAVGLLFLIVGVSFLKPIVRLLGATETILPYAADYMLYILIGTPFMSASMALNNQLRLQGSPTSGMIGIAIGAVLNIGLDPLFIFVFHMGTGGAGCATAISQAVSFFILLWMTGRRGNIPIKWKNFTATRALFAEIWRGGFPTFARQILNSVATIFLNRAAGVYGDAAIAAMAIVSRIMSLVNSTALGFGQGFQPVCGYNYGAGNYDRVLKGFWFSVRVTLVGLTAICAAGFLFAEPIVGVFRDDPAVIAIGARALRYQCIAFPLIGWTIILNMFSQNIGDAFEAGLMAIARQGAFFLPALWVLSRTMGLLGIQLTQTTADILTLILSVPIGARVLRRVQKLRDAC